MKADQIIEIVSHPSDWPRPWRRAFILTLPVSLPLWMALMFALCSLIGCAALLLYPAMLLEDLWRGE